MSRKRKRGDEPKDENVLEFNRDLSLIEFNVNYHGIRVINKLVPKLSNSNDGWLTRGSIEHLPSVIEDTKTKIKSFLNKKYEKRAGEAGFYIEQKDIDSLKTALGELNKYTYPEPTKEKYGTITNWKDIIKDLDSNLNPIFKKIRESYMKYLPENERVIPFAPLEPQEDDSISRYERQTTVHASVGGRRKYRKKRTKKRRKSKGIKRRKSRRKKRRKSRRRKRTRKRR